MPFEHARRSVTRVLTMKKPFDVLAEASVRRIVGATGHRWNFFWRASRAGSLACGGGCMTEHQVPIDLSFTSTASLSKKGLQGRNVFRENLLALYIERYIIRYVLRFVNVPFQ